MNFIKTIFTYVPFAVFALTYLMFVRRCRLGGFGRKAWSCWLLFCCMKFLAFRCLGGDVFYPDFPQPLIWAWNWAYSGSMILCALSIPFVLWKSRRKAWCLPLVAWTLSAIGLWNGLRPPAANEVELRHPALPAELDGYRIVLISDIHCSHAARKWRTESVVDVANALYPDLVCLCGDFVDGTAAEHEADIAPIAGLKAVDGVFAVTGNHEYYFDFQGWKRAYARLGIRFLWNECVHPRPSLAVAGVPDIAAGLFPDERQPNVATAFEAATNGEFRVLMQHQPLWARGNVSRHRVNLQLSGHTHGGIMPGLSGLVRNANGGFLRGLYRLAGGYLYVSPGSGQWAGFPLRFFNPSEITCITLKKTRGKK